MDGVAAQLGSVPDPEDGVHGVVPAGEPLFHPLEALLRRLFLGKWKFSDLLCQGVVSVEWMDLRELLQSAGAGLLREAGQRSHFIDVVHQQTEAMAADLDRTTLHSSRILAGLHGAEVLASLESH